jgi:hypothetical protein
MIRYSHAMTCLMAYHNKKRIEAISTCITIDIHLMVGKLGPKCALGYSYVQCSLQELGWVTARL